MKKLLLTFMLGMSMVGPIYSSNYESPNKYANCVVIINSILMGIVCQGYGKFTCAKSSVAAQSNVTYQCSAVGYDHVMPCKNITFSSCYGYPMQDVSGWSNEQKDTMDNARY